MKRAARRRPFVFSAVRFATGDRALEADAGAGGDEVDVLEVRDVLHRAAHRVVLVGEPELHGRCIHVLGDTDAPVGERVAAAAVGTHLDRFKRTDGAESRSEVRILANTLPLAVLAVEHGIADAEEIPGDAAGEVEEARVEVTTIATLNGE